MLQRGRLAGADRLQRGRQPEQYAGGEREEQRESEHPLIESGVDRSHAAISVRIAQHRISDSVDLDFAVLKAGSLLHKGGTVENVTLAMCVTYGLYMGTKAVHIAQEMVRGM